MSYKPASQNPVKLTRDEQINMWSDMLAFFMWYPDLFLDACRPKDPETGELLGISLDFSQRMFLRSLFRMEQSYHCYPRGWGKTLVEILATYVKAILIPNYTQFMTAQSLKHASDLFKQKHAEVIKFFPFIENEFAKEPSIKEGRVEIYFKNGSLIGILPNTNDAKGSRANCITSEESALMNKEVFDDAIEPIVSEPYPNQRKQSQNNPFVINGLHFITTTYFASLDAFQHNKDVMEGMVNLQGQVAFGASWRLPVAFKRGRRAEEYISIKSRVSPLAWETNYESRWVGGAQNCLIPIHMLMDMRQIEEPELFGDGEHDYYMGIDVARSDNPDQCFTSIEVLKVYRDKYNAVKQIDVIYLTNVKGTYDFETQAVIIKKLQRNFQAKAVVLDANGVGMGLGDMLLKRTTDPKTGITYPAFDHVNWKDRKSNDPTAIRCLYNLKAQGINEKIIATFITTMQSIVRLLVNKDLVAMNLSDDIFSCKELCYVQTDMLIEEINNLKTVETGVFKKLTVETISSKWKKDRYSALAYVLYYLITEDNLGQYEAEEEETDPELLRMLRGTFSAPRIR